MKVVGNYELQEVLGTGNHSTVFRTLHTPTGKLVAAKCIPKSLGSSDISMIKAHAHSMQMVDFPFFVTVFEIIEDARHIYIIMEYLKNGRLMDFIKAKGKLCEAAARRIFVQLIVLMDYLMANKSMSKNSIDLSQILLDADNNIRLTDFYEEKNTRFSIQEYYDKSNYFQAYGVYLAGAVLYLMVNGVNDGNVQISQELFEKIGTALSESDQIPSAIASLLARIFTKDPRAKLTYESLFDCDWLNSWSLSRKYKDIKVYLKFLLFNKRNLDPSIIQKLETKKIETENLFYDMTNEQMTFESICYKIIRRNTMMIDFEASVAEPHGKGMFSNRTGIASRRSLNLGINRRISCPVMASTAEKLEVKDRVASFTEVQTYLNLD